MSRSFRRFLARNRTNPIVKKFARHIKSWHRGFENFDYDPRHNGEAFLIGALSEQQDTKKVIFDVGANIGEWSELALEKCTMAEIHAFELVPDTSAQLMQLLEERPNVTVNRFGLSDRSGNVAVKINADDSTRSTLITNADLDTDNSMELECEVRTGDDYLIDNKIIEIDLLKIDAEGADHLVLKGFSEALSQNRVKCIQFEYGKASIATRFLLKDYYEYLTAFGFDLGKLYLQHVDFRPYSQDMEDFLGPNFVAVHQSQTALHKRLSL